MVRPIALFPVVAAAVADGRVSSSSSMTTTQPSVSAVPIRSVMSPGERQNHHIKKRRLQQEQEQTCTFDSGRVYQPGEVVDGEDFATRCGPADEFPCYCSPNRTPFPVECPYCSIIDTSSPNGVTCAKNGQTVTVVNTDRDFVQECSCRVEITTGTPIKTCIEVTDDVNNPGGDGGDGNGNANNGGCTIELFDGTSATFQEGESFGVFFPTRCANEEGTGLGGGDNSIQFECFCNPDVPGEVECPFCTFVDVQGDLFCANQFETVVFQDPDLGPVECACFNDLTSTCRPVSPTEAPLSNPLTTTPSTTMSTNLPTSQPTNTPSAPDVNTQLPTVDQDDHGDDGVDKSIGRPPLDDDPSLGGCLYHNNYDNTIEFLKEGEVFDSRVASGPCSPSTNWPVFCNPAASLGGMEYPYCVFSTWGVQDTNSDGGGSAIVRRNYRNGDGINVVCARSEERVTVTNLDGSTQECSCLYFNPELGPVSSCDLLTVDLVLALPPTAAPTSENERKENNAVDDDADDVDRVSIGDARSPAEQDQGSGVEPNGQLSSAETIRTNTLSISSLVVLIWILS